MHLQICLQNVWADAPADTQAYIYMYMPICTNTCINILAITYADKSADIPADISTDASAVQRSDEGGDIFVSDWNVVGGLGDCCAVQQSRPPKASLLTCRA